MDAESIYRQVGDFKVIMCADAGGGPIEARSALIGPVSHKPLLYGETPHNIKLAIEGRIDKKYKDPTIDAELREKIWRYAETAKGYRGNKKERGIFSTERIDAWARKNLYMGCDLEDLRSKKWTTKRMENEINCLLQKIDPKIRLELGIKLENMGEGKYPRFLIKDKDRGQVMSLPVIKCFEDLLFEHFKKKCIKHKPRDKGLDDLFEELRSGMKNSEVIEADGSAWDTCCGPEIRDLLENGILEHITGYLAANYIVPESWLKRHLEVCKTDKFKLYFGKKGSKDYEETIGMIIAELGAIRRSGHRGTSVLNWWLNYSLWHICIFEDPTEFLDYTRVCGKDVWGTKRKLKSGMEGDDSGLNTSPSIKRHQKDIEAFWDKVGFNMKISFPKDYMTFCGVRVALDDKGPIPGRWLPEVHRAMRNAGVSKSPALMEGVWARGEKCVASVAACTYLSRSYAYAGRSPTLSKKYLQYSDEWASHYGIKLGALSYEDRMACLGEPTMQKGEVESLRDVIDLKNANFDEEKEIQLMKDCGYEVSSDELAKFRMVPWLVDNIMPPVEFRECIPASWRI